MTTIRTIMTEPMSPPSPPEEGGDRPFLHALPDRDRRTLLAEAARAPTNPAK